MRRSRKLCECHCMYKWNKWETRSARKTWTVYGCNQSKRRWFKWNGFVHLSMLKSICPPPILEHGRWFRPRGWAFSFSLLLFLFMWYIRSDSCGPWNKQCHSNLSFLHTWHPRLCWSFGKVMGCTWPAVRQNNEGQKHNAPDMDWNGLQSWNGFYPANTSVQMWLLKTLPIPVTLLSLSWWVCY